MRAPPSGRQHVLERGGQAGGDHRGRGTLRSYSHNDVELLDTFSAASMSDSCRGQVLAPWPNRIDHGRYRFEGRERKFALSEPERDTAIHGLVRWLPFAVADAAEDALRLSCLLYPQDGYEFMLGIEMGYRLGSQGLEVELGATNLGAEPAPFGAGFHPYLSSGQAVSTTTGCRCRHPLC